MSKFENVIKSIDLMITEECNLSCEYCFHEKKPTTMTLEQGKKILDRMKELSPEEMTVTFFGGEPFLYPQLILDLSKYALSLWGKRIRLHVVTNATVFDQEIFTELSKMPFSIQVSIDGDEITNKEHRGGDFKEICGNIIKIRDMFGSISARMTYTPKTVGRLSTNIEFIHRELGINKIMHHAVMEADWTDDSAQLYQTQLNHVYHYRRFCLKRDIPIDIHFIERPLSVLDEDEKADKNFCEAGKTYIAIGADGDCYPCHRAFSSRVFRLGNIFEEVPFIRGIFLNIDKQSTGCWKMCDSARTCHSCIITAYKVHGDLNKPIGSYCKICQIENKQASMYLPTEISDRNRNLLIKLGSVVADMATELGELRQDINNSKKELGE